MSSPSLRAHRRTLQFFPRHLLMVACGFGSVIGLLSVIFLALSVVLAPSANDPKAAFTLVAFGVAGAVGLIVGLVSAAGFVLLLPGTLRRVRANREAWVADVLARNAESGRP